MHFDEGSTALYVGKWERVYINNVWKSGKLKKLHKLLKWVWRSGTTKDTSEVADNTSINFSNQWAEIELECFLKVG